MFQAEAVDEEAVALNFFPTKVLCNLTNLRSIKAHTSGVIRQFSTAVQPQPAAHSAAVSLPMLCRAHINGPWRNLSKSA